MNFEDNIRALAEWATHGEWTAEIYTCECCARLNTPDGGMYVSNGYACIHPNDARLLAACDPETMLLVSDVLAEVTDLFVYGAFCDDSEEDRRSLRLRKAKAALDAHHAREKP